MPTDTMQPEPLAEARDSRTEKRKGDSVQRFVKHLVYFSGGICSWAEGKRTALKYGADGADKRVEIRVAAADQDALLNVRDHGPGIPAEHLPRLTERFYRIDAGQSRARGGTGLGLAIVKHIVVRHRGRLRIESLPGDGSSFSVTIPLCQN